MANTNTANPYISDFQVCTLNVNGLADTSKANLLTAQPDSLPHNSIFALQETRLSVYTNNKFQSFVSPGTSRSCGCIIPISHQFLVDFDVSVHSFQHDCQSKLTALILVSCRDNKFILKILNVYAPNNHCERKYFFNSTLSSYLGLSTHNIVLGDFNCITSVSDTTSRSAHCRALESGAELSDLCETFDLNEGDYDGAGPGVKYTWHRLNERAASRLDRVYKLVSWPAVYYHKHCAFSDHSIVFCKFERDAFNSSTGFRRTFWKK